MDIAKIRKKLKDSESGRPAVEGETTGVREENPSDNQIREPEVVHEPTSETVSSRAEQETLRIEPSPEEEKVPSAQAPKPVEEAPYFKQETGLDKKEKIQYKEKKENEDEDGDEPDKTNEVIEILTFKLFEEEFAFRISQLKEILRFQRITRVPKMPGYVLGITSLRGKVIPVIDLRTKILSHEKAAEIDEKLKILIIKGPKGMIGAVIDKLIGVIRIAKADILPPPTHLSEEQLKFIEGIAVLEKRFISIINMEEAITINLN
jgi:purine-binding chemotaxis protein CheW